MSSSTTDLRPLQVGTRLRVVYEGHTLDWDADEEEDDDDVKLLTCWQTWIVLM